MDITLLEIQADGTIYIEAEFNGKKWTGTLRED